MRPRPIGFVISVLVSGALFSGCADSGSSGTHASAVPQGGGSAVGRAPRGDTRRTQSVPTCSGTGGGSFVGGGAHNVADADNSGVLEGQSNEVCDDETAIGGGAYNSISSGSDSATLSWIGGGYENTITGNAPYSVIGGGSYNALAQQNSVIGGGQNNTITSAQGLGVIAGGGNNTSSGSAAVISGGYGSANAGQNGVIGGGQQNTVSSAAQYATIAGGSSNGATGAYAVLGGGTSNKVSGAYGAIAGGLNNSVSGEGAYIAAGGYNTVSGEGAVIDGGFNSTAAGTFATIPGGYVNNAAGTYSFAAGARASAAQTGTFVWSDGSDGDTILTSSRTYQFLARASGGFTLWTNAASTVGATLAPGSGTWASASDRNMKTNVAPVDDAAVLDKVSRLPIKRWSYITERGVRHVGPMAQDFYAAFGVGEDDKHITSIDEDGVALAAIKALHAENVRLKAGQRDLRSRLAAATTSQATRIAAMQTQIQRLTTEMAALRTR
jgi:hypothetical protein